MKRIAVICLCLLALVGVLATAVSAKKDTPLTPQEALIQEAKQSYRRSLYAAGKSSFHGYCGLMVSCQLRALGVNSWRITNDGNKHFDYYKELEVTDGGFYINAYDASEYSMEDCLNALSRHGTKTVRNVMVCFQWTNTDAGKRYGHVVLINGILDGTVYFVESFDLRMNGKFFPEGQVVRCSIEDFVAYYSSWTQYEGIIHLGSGQYSDGCQEYGTNVTLQARFDTGLRSQPSTLGQNGSVLLRKVAAGQRLQATAILENHRGDCFYRIEENGQVGYVPATAVIPRRADPGDLMLVDAQLPTVIDRPEKSGFQGAVMAQNGGISAVEAVVTDSQGQPVGKVTCGAAGYRWELQQLGDQLALHTLEPGLYKLELYAECAQPVLVGRALENFTGWVRLQGQLVQVGGNVLSAKPYPVLQKQVQQPLEGWVLRDGKWYFYEDENLRSGWLSYEGSRYYLDETGAAVTGWQELEGKRLYFSGTGALVTGWLSYNGITTWHQPDGSLVTGWQELEGALYYFAEDGAMVTDKKMKKDGVVYVLAPDGKATEKADA